MRDALDRLWAEPMLHIDPELGFLIATAWPFLRGTALPEALEDFDALTLTPDVPTADRLRQHIAGVAQRCGRTGDAALLDIVGHWISPAWADLLDASRATPWPDPAFIALALTSPDRAERRIAEAMASDPASPRGPALLYGALCAWHDAKAHIPAGVHALREVLEAADPFDVAVEARERGRLRWLARTDLDRALTVADDALDFVGADPLFAGLWAVLARVDDPHTLARRWASHTPACPEAVVAAEVRATSQPHRIAALWVHALHDHTDALRPEDLVSAVWHLLDVSLRCDDAESVDALLSLGPPPWVVEHVAWRPLRQRPERGEAIHDWLLDPERPAALALALPPPPTSRLPAARLADRLSLKSDPRVTLPSGTPWGSGPP